ncbi:MAG TPA: hypothetical protein HPP90_07430 [Deltaproteobacteria bacterium]|nr:hypothetical protein [Deltaproteobacteria bacterium]
MKKLGDDLRKWTLLPAGQRHREILQLAGLTCAGLPFVPRLPGNLTRFRGRHDNPLRMECILARHNRWDGIPSMPSIFGSGLTMDEAGRLTPLNRHSCELLPSAVPVVKVKMGNGIRRFFLLGYGSAACFCEGQDDFDFEDPFHRLRRFKSLYDNSTPITNPIAFLERLHYKAILKSRYPARQTMNRLCRLLTEYLYVDTSPWLERACDFGVQWAQLKAWQKRACLPVLDAVRYMVDVFSVSGKPLDQPGVMLLDRPDLFCATEMFPKWMTLLDRLLPSMQCLLSVSEKARSQCPSDVLLKRLPLPAPPDKAPEKKPPRRVGGGNVLLIQLDGRLPNLALMKLSQYYKGRGKKVILERRKSRITGADAVYASCVFAQTPSWKRTVDLKNFYGDSLILGGSGVDLEKKLPAEIEAMPADYSLYPELGDRAIGFLTRGCPFRCLFCIVPRKEGDVRQVSALDELLQDNRKKLILLDDNILAHPAANAFLEEMVHRDLQVNFTQTLDISLLNRETAALLRRIRCTNTKFTRTVYHFSLNDTRRLGLVGKKYRLMNFTPGDNVEFVCMYGYNTTLAQDVERFRFLRSLPGAYVFVQQYQPIEGGPSPQLTHYFDDNADELIDELIRIVFTQNMKSMEKYYRWLSRFYAGTFKRLHKGLVDTIFRYNHRFEKGHYIATMAGTRKNVRLP